MTSVACLQPAIRNLQFRVPHAPPRKNLKSIGESAGEKHLRERYLKTLNAQEDRLERIAREIEEKTRAREACQARINMLLGKLEYDAEVFTPCCAASGYLSHAFAVAVVNSSS